MKGKFHILIMASGFSSYEMSSFNTKAQEIKNKLLSTEPFKSYSSNIDVHIYNNTSDLGCYSGCNNIDRLICCDGYDVTSAAATSGYYYDEIIVVHNIATYAGSGYRDYSSYQTNSYNSYTTVYKGDFSETMALHEFGHSFGDLCDEYSYGSENYTYYDCVNCRTSCTDWSNLTTACTQGCDAKPSYYRPEDSVMLSLEIDKYNIVSIQRSLKPRLEYFIPTAQQTGSLTVTILPSTSATADGQWQVDNTGVWNNSGATVSNLTVGNHTISFKTITGWTAPASQTVTITNGQTATATGTYTQQSGSLTVTLSPATSVTAGGMWQVDNTGVWNNSGATVNNLTVGNHTVSFKTITGWTTPVSQTVTIQNGVTTTSTATYIQQSGSLTVTISPATAVTAGGQWQVDNTGVWNNNGVTVLNLTVGTHTVSFKDVTGWTKPANQTVIIQNGVTATATGTYIKIELPENVSSYKVLTDQSPEITINYGEYVRVFGSSGGNTISVKSGGRVECVNFVGSNIVNLDDASSGFTVYRSGATVYLESLTKGTKIKIPATKTSQTVKFAGGVSYNLVISSGKVMLGSQEIKLTKVQI